MESSHAYLCAQLPMLGAGSSLKSELLEEAILFQGSVHKKYQSLKGG